MSSVLLVDDEAGIRTVMRRWTESLGYDVREADNAEGALRLMADRASDVVVCDIGMPGHDGLWLVERIRANHPNSAVVMATGATDVDAALFSLQQGVVDYLVKPFDREHLRASLRRGVEAHREAVKSRQRFADLEKRLRERVAELTRRITEVGVTSERELEDVLVTLMADDRPAWEHGQRVATLATNIALVLDVRGGELAAIGHAARLHDLGRLATPEEILSKRGRLSDEEREIIKRRPTLVSDALRACAFLEQAADIVRSMHEHYDGRGYPWGLQAGEIPLGARIAAVADVFDTITHPRVHRDARPLSEALFEIQRCRGTQFDPAVVDALLRVAGLHWNSGARAGTGSSEAPRPAGPLSETADDASTPG